LNACSNLLLEVLKLRNCHKNIILSVLDTLCIIAEEFQGEVRRCVQFCNSSFLNRLFVIAKGEDDSMFVNDGNARKMEQHTEDVRMKAAQLLDHINPLNS
jgi:hypothetical protein